MTTILYELKQAYLASGTKRVTRTDKNKAAYVLTAEQVEVLRAANIAPHRTRSIPVHIIGAGPMLQSSYYLSERKGSGRSPEPRMGREIIHWLDVGDTLFLATDGKKIFARKLLSTDSDARPAEEIAPAIEAVHRALDPTWLLNRARRVSGAPRRSKVLVVQYERNVSVRMLALMRSKGRCEMPGCGWKGFRKNDGTVYMQIHHIRFLSLGGHDTIWNTCALCPNCHALAHHSPRREKIAATLRRAVAAATRKL